MLSFPQRLAQARAAAAAAEAGGEEEEEEESEDDEEAVAAGFGMRQVGLIALCLPASNAAAASAACQPGCSGATSPPLTLIPWCPLAPLPLLSAARPARPGRPARCLRGWSLLRMMRRRTQSCGMCCQPGTRRRMRQRRMRRRPTGRRRWAAGCSSRRQPRGALHMAQPAGGDEATLAICFVKCGWCVRDTACCAERWHFPAAAHACCGCCCSWLLLAGCRRCLRRRRRGLPRTWSWCR